MARTYKRDKNGRFAGSGGGGKLGKSAKNEAARAKYKEAASNARSAQKEFGGNSPAAGSKTAARAIAGAKSGLTRVTKGLHGGTAGNLGRTKRDDANTARKGLAGIYGKSRAAKAAAPKAAAKKASGSVSNQVAAGRAAKAAYQSKAASKRKAKVAKAGGSFTKTSTFRNSLKGKQARARNAKKAAKK